jgi:phosphomannomutase
MLETKSQVGGEGSSGGFIFSDFNHCRDGILTSGLISSMILKDTFHDMLNFMEKYHIIRDKIECKLEHQDQVMKTVYKNLNEKYNEIQIIDGIKVIVDENTWILIRKSNTEDIIRMSIESESLEKSRNIHQETKELIKQSYEQIN